MLLAVMNNWQSCFLCSPSLVHWFNKHLYIVGKEWCNVCKCGHDQRSKRRSAYALYRRYETHTEYVVTANFVFFTERAMTILRRTVRDVLRVWEECGQREIVTVVLMRWW